MTVTYEMIEQHMQRMYEFGRTNNPVSAQCECQAVRIKMGFTGPGAIYAPTTPAQLFECDCGKEHPVGFVCLQKDQL